MSACWGPNSADTGLLSEDIWALLQAGCIPPHSTWLRYRGFGAVSHVWSHLARYRGTGECVSSTSQASLLSSSEYHTRLFSSGTARRSSRVTAQARQFIAQRTGPPRTFRPCCDDVFESVHPESRPCAAVYSVWLGGFVGAALPCMRCGHALHCFCQPTSHDSHQISESGTLLLDVFTSKFLRIRNGVCLETRRTPRHCQSSISSPSHQVPGCV